MLLEADGPGDRKRALEFFQKACDGDNGDGCFGLANCYRHGWGGSTNSMTADTLMKKSCDLGNATACKEFRR